MRLRGPLMCDGFIFQSLIVENRNRLTGLVPHEMPERFIVAHC